LRIPSDNYKSGADFMAKISVKFTYLTGVKERLFTNARLHGEWDENGHYSDIWAITPMREITGEDGCPAFCAIVEFDSDQINREFRWGVSFDTDTAKDVWGIMSEVNAADSRDRVRSLRLTDTGSNEPRAVNYYLNESRRLGAQKYYKEGADEPGIRFAVWAPNARRVQAVMSYVWNDYDFERRPSFNPNKRPAIQSLPRSDIAGGYIADEGTGSHPAWGPFEMTRLEDGIWVSDVDDPELADFAKFDHSPYMFEITKDDGSVAYRSDLYSRCQIGFGDYRPSGKFLGNVGDLDGTISCSVIVDPDNPTTPFKMSMFFVENGNLH
jgi:1,4-alpha-glucan branching enzyme